MTSTNHNKPNQISFLKTTPTASDLGRCMSFSFCSVYHPRDFLKKATKTLEDSKDIPVKYQC